jgi:hypothetical protein
LDTVLVVQVIFVPEDEGEPADTAEIAGGLRVVNIKSAEDDKFPDESVDCTW